MRKPERKKRKSKQLDALAHHVHAELDKVDNQELLTFKIPILLEYLLVFILAKRLNVDEDDLPNLDYADLATLALSGTQFIQARERVLKLGEVRNYLAHYLDRDVWLDKVREFVALCELPVPESDEQLLLVYDLALDGSYIQLFLVAASVVSADSTLFEEWLKDYQAKQKLALGTLKVRAVNPKPRTG